MKSHVNGANAVNDGTSTDDDSASDEESNANGAGGSAKNAAADTKPKGNGVGRNPKEKAQDGSSSKEKSDKGKGTQQEILLVKENEQRLIDYLHMLVFDSQAEDAGARLDLSRPISRQNAETFAPHEKWIHTLLQMVSTRDFTNHAGSNAISWYMPKGVSEDLDVARIVGTTLNERYECMQRTHRRVLSARYRGPDIRTCRAHRCSSKGSRQGSNGQHRQ